ncbi:MAG: divergent PAP2 family protein, partial [Erysipelotrichales bacterium]
MFYDYYPLIAALLANVIAQFLKPFALYLKTKSFDKYQFLAAGGFPSSHTSTVTSLALAIGLKEGFDSS